MHLADIVLEPGAALGAGAYGVVRAATWRGVPIAVKLLHSEADAVFGPEEVAAFEAELVTHCALRHPNVIKVHGCVVDESTRPKPTYAIVMERMNDSVYKRFVAKGAATASIAAKLQVLLDIAQGLAHLHANGIMHLDLKSMNTLIDARGTAKLTDFGLSNIKAAIARTAAAQCLRGAGTSVIGGTLPGMAPELIAMEEPTKAADVYAVGILMWDALAQAMQYAEVTGVRNPLVQLPAFVSGGGRPSLVMLTSDLPTRIRELMVACWAQDMDARPPTPMGAVLAGVEDACVAMLWDRHRAAELHSTKRAPAVAAGGSVAGGSNPGGPDTDGPGPAGVPTVRAVVSPLAGGSPARAANPGVSTVDEPSSCVVASRARGRGGAAARDTARDAALNAVARIIPGFRVGAERALAGEGAQTSSTAAGAMPGIDAAGALVVLIAAVKAGGDDADMVASASGQWAKLAGTPHNQALIAGVGAIPPLVAGLTRHADNASVVAAVSSALRNLAANPENEVPIAAAGAIAPLVRALTHHAENAGVIEPVSDALANLA